MESKKPLLSIGMIVKNEIRCIERCLKALAPLREAVPCELVIADTGSDDGTREVIERYADLVFDFTWIDDFSAARNAVIDRCSGQWYLTVDADEYLDENINELIAFLKVGVAQGAVAAGLIVRNYASLAMDLKNSSDFVGLRIFRLDKGIRYTGSIHESVELGGKGAALLQNTILHHDGYAFITPEFSKQKAERNMKLLREELSNDPDNLRRLLQCIESSVWFPREQMGYVMHAMELLLQGRFNPNDIYLAPLCRLCVCIALNHELPQTEEWLSWAETHIATSIYFRIDVTAAATVFYREKEMFDDALSWGKRYLGGLDDYEAKKFGVEEIACSTFLYKTQMHELKRREIIADCLIRQEEYQAAVDCLKLIDPCVGDAQMSGNYLLLLSELVKFSVTRSETKTLCATFIQRLLTDKTISSDIRNICMKVLVQCFNEKGKCLWQLFADVEGEIGLAAHMMDEKNSETLSGMLEEVQHWNLIPSVTLYHLIQCGVSLPDSFYQKSCDGLWKLAAALSEFESFPMYFLWWAEREKTTSLARLQFLIDLGIASAARRCTEQPDAVDQKVFGLLQAWIGQYLPELYSSRILQGEKDWGILPAQHQFMLWLFHAQNALSAGDELDCVRALNAALAIAPSLKNMIDFLLQQMEQNRLKTASPELLELAEKVRAILAQYPPDDPVIEVLKQSDAYQRVAYLIEGVGAPVWGGFPQ